MPGEAYETDVSLAFVFAGAEKVLVYSNVVIFEPFRLVHRTDSAEAVHLAQRYGSFSQQVADMFNFSRPIYFSFKRRA